MTGAHTPGPWGWVIEDHSMASLGVLPDPGLGNPLVMAIGPCSACASRADGEWKWGRCQTPNEADATLIAAAPDMLAALTRIAAFDDEIASNTLGICGSYGAFDEPGSVQTARECLARITPLPSGSIER